MKFFISLVLAVAAQLINTLPESGTPPQGRRAASMATDSENKKIYILGGLESSDLWLNDIWQFDISKAEWTELQAINKGPGSFHSAHAFKINNHLYVYGGMMLQGPSSDLWKFDLKSYKWTSVPTTGIKPGVYVKSCLGSYEYNNITYLSVFGQNAKNSSLGELYILFRLDTSDYEWKKHTTTFLAVFNGNIVALNENLFIFGGESISNKPNNSTYTFNLNNFTWTKTSDQYMLNKVFFGSGTYSDSIFAMSGEQSSDLQIKSKIDIFDSSIQKWAESSNSAPYLIEYAYGQISESLYMFGGRDENSVTNQLLVLSLSTKKLKVLSAEYKNPGAVKYASLVSISNSLLLFGGMKGGKKLNALWKYELSESTWSLLSPSGNTPSARSHAGITCQGDILIIWGGQGETSYLNDAYFYNFKTNIWTKIENSGISPNPQYGTCLALSFPYLYILGGNSLYGTTGTLWLYDFSTNEYSLIEPKLNFTPGYNRFCELQKTEDDIFAYIALGTTDNSKSLGSIEKYSLTSKSSQTVFSFNNFANNRSDASIHILNQKAYIFGGQTWGTEAKKQIQIIDLVKGTSSTYKSELTSAIFSAAFTYLGNKLYAYGGGTEYGSQIVPLGASSLFYSLDLSKIEGSAQSLCSPGTYFSSKECLFCSSGTYNSEYGQDSCQMCPEGTENPIVGAQSERQCYPCKQGFYSNSSAQAKCLKCPESYACPVGSSEFALGYRTDSISSDQPGIMKRNTAEANRLGSIIQIIVLVVGAFILLILFSTEKTRKVLITIDLYNSLHNYELDVPMMMRKTFFGSVFSMVFAILALILLIQTLILYFMDNVMEDKSLITMVILEEKVDKFYGDVNVDIVFYNYGGNCVINDTCSDGLIVDEYLLDYDDVTRQCEKTKDSCSLYLSYKNCEVDVESQIFVYLKETFSYSSSIYVKFESSSSIKGKTSSITAEVQAESGKIFRGKNPTVFEYSLIPSLFDYDGSERTGYHVTIKSAPSPGTMILPEDLGYTDYQSLQLLVSRDINALYILRFTIYTETLLVMALIGSIMGVMRMIGGAMSFVEGNYLAQKAKQDQKNKVQKLEENRKMPLKNLVTEDDLHNNT